ncbi:hypothetical protein [Nocardia paucivorans]|uniref:hypothetical protein n=1 Tax=Nocardia paucivorans TaxID=114259 RepID=UPI0002F50048|nr:hypothetical protein [Nocardia paucivorans]
MAVRLALGGVVLIVIGVLGIGRFGAYASVAGALAVIVACIAWGVTRKGEASCTRK